MCSDMFNMLDYIQILPCNGISPWKRQPSLAKTKKAKDDGISATFLAMKCFIWQSIGAICSNCFSSLIVPNSSITCRITDSDSTPTSSKLWFVEKSLRNIQVYLWGKHVSVLTLLYYSAECSTILVSMFLCNTILCQGDIKKIQTFLFFYINSEPSGAHTIGLEWNAM